MAKNSDKSKVSVRSQPWERMYNTNEPSAAMKADKGSMFNPKSGCDRPTTYVKVNKTDH